MTDSTSTEGLRTEGISNGRGSVEGHRGGWLVVESTNGGLSVWLVIDISDLEHIWSSSGSTVLLESESNSLNVFSDTQIVGSVISGGGLSGSTGSSSRITSEA